MENHRKIPEVDGDFQWENVRSSSGGFASKLCHLCWRLFEYVVPEVDFTRKIAW